MSDGDPSITRAVSKVFPTALRLTCFFHMKKQVKMQMTNKGVPKERRSKILKEISLLQLAHTVPVFLSAAKKLVKQWRNEGMTRFSQYFRRIWIRGPLRFWFEGSMPGSVLTNNGLESLHSIIKRQ
uniref:MULE transposase domain-containing protein n=1 Tax=Plectus sambesii TaxID=2011161 RepID=A0A914WS92_9BILA